MLIPFHSPDASDSTWVRPLLQSEGLALCDYSFPVLFCWKDAYGFQYAPLGKRLLVRLTSSLGHSYLWPRGEGDPTPALDALTQDARAEGPAPAADLPDPLPQKLAGGPLPRPLLL